MDDSTTRLDALGSDDAKHLASLEKKMQLVRDRVTAVVKGYATGYYLYGAGGTGKGYAVTQHLDALKANWRLFNSRITAKGLFQVLAREPAKIHLLDDIERITKDHDAQSLLRAALWAQPGKERVVKWTTATGGEERATFAGGLILMANRPLANLPELQALATRIAVHHLEVTDAELAAQMRELAREGYQRKTGSIEPDRCLEICAYLLAECRSHGCPLDLRLWDTSCGDYLLWEHSHSSCYWRDLISARVRESAAHFRRELVTLSREERLEADRQTVRDICRETQDPVEQLRSWKERTGRGKSSWYARKREVDSGEWDV
jgi:hypothetical protein